MHIAYASQTNASQTNACVFASCLFVCELVPVLHEGLYINSKVMIYIILYCWCKDVYMLIVHGNASSTTL